MFQENKEKTMRKNQKLVTQAQNLSASDLNQFLADAKLNYSFEILHASQLSNDCQRQILELFETNMKSLYEQSKDGYNQKEKSDELFSDQARYLLILSACDIIAYAHFRFDMDYGRQVVYLYELQVNGNYRSQGLGQWIMEQLKKICAKTQMSKIVLTVQKLNVKAIEFYMKKCHFEIDSTDPNDEDVDYKILSFSV